MNDSLVATLMHLRALVACDAESRRARSATDGIFDYLRSVLLAGFPRRFGISAPAR
jgi:hypothetical protein